MEIAMMVVLGVVLAYLVVRFGPRAQREAAKKESGQIEKARIGDGLRRLNANKQRYKEMTPALLAETPEDMLIEAVLSNLWAKMQPDLSDALTVMRTQSPERQHVFAVYAITGGVKQAGFEKIKDCPDAELLPVALEGLRAMDMPQSADLLQKAIDEEDADAYNTPYSDTFDGENGKDKLSAYIRAHATAFTDAP